MFKGSNMGKDFDIEKYKNMKKTHRGFLIFGEVESDRYGAKIAVQESSIVGEGCCWVFTYDTEETKRRGIKDLQPHLTMEQAKIIRDALSDFIELEEWRRTREK